MAATMMRVIALLLIFAFLASSPARADDDPAVTIRMFFLNAGMQPFQAEAFTRHAWIESNYNHCVIARSGSRWLFQWVGKRATMLAEFAHMSGCPPLETQLRFALYEIRSEPAYKCFWQAETYSSALAALRRGFGRGHC